MRLHGCCALVAVVVGPHARCAREMPGVLVCPAQADSNLMLAMLRGMPSARYEAHLAACGALLRHGSIDFAGFVADGLCAVEGRVQALNPLFEMSPHCRTAASLLLPVS